MSLLIWLPLIDNTENQGLANINMINHNVTSNTAGKLGNCYQFNGSTAYINENSYDWTKFNVHQFTLCCWYKEPSPVASGNSQIIHIGTSSGWNNIRIGLLRRTSNGYPLFSISDGTNNINYNFAATSFSLDVWHHIAVTYDNGKLTMYLDGQVNKTMTTTIVPVITASHHLGIGGAADGAEKLTGFLNDVRIYDTALSPREIKEISKGLVLHYTLSGIGNPNLCIPQVSDSKWTLWSQGSSWNSINTREKVVDENGKTWCHVIQTTTSGYGGYACSPGANYNGIVIDPNKKYTISALAKTNETTIQKMVLWCHWRVAGGGGSNLAQTITTVDVTSTPKRVYATWTPTAGSTGSTVGSINLMLGTLNNISNIYFTDVKFEEGEVATPWLPNSTDPEYAAFGLNDGIEYDVSGYQNNGTKTNVVFSSDTPKYNGSSYFDGTSLIQVNPLPSEVKTISVWCKTTKNKSTSQFICQDSASGLCVTFYKGKIISHLGGSSSTGSKCTLGDSYIENGWNHFVVLKTGTHTRDVYCNGVKLTPTSNDYWSPTTGFLVGARNMSNGLPFYGYISDLRAYTTLLSEEDILALYNTPITLSSNGTLLTQGEYVEV